MIDIETALIGAAPLLIAILVAMLFERMRPIESKPLKPSTRFNLLYIPIFTMIQAVVKPLLSVVTVLIVNSAGGGWIDLPTTGFGLFFGFLIYALTLDGMEYLFHRAQHRFPVMWAMHSFHHSDTALNASSTIRHYWAEHGIKMVTIFLVVGLLFKADPLILGMYALLSFYNVFAHMNLRFGFGRWSMLMNSPQYHRIHHSKLPEHYDYNYAALFPIFDVICGTYHQPLEDEYPPTGIASDDSPSGIVEAMCWPFRGLLRRLAPSQAA